MMIIVEIVEYFCLSPSEECLPLEIFGMDDQQLGELSHHLLWIPQGSCLPSSPELPSFFSFASKPPVPLKSGNHPVNYAVKPVDAMQCFIKMFSNPGWLHCH